MVETKHRKKNQSDKYQFENKNNSETNEQLE